MACYKTFGLQLPPRAWIISRVTESPVLCPGSCSQAAAERVAVSRQKQEVWVRS